MDKKIELCTMRAGDLKNGFGNPRKITKSKLEELCSSMEMFGDFGIFLIDEEDNVIAGNQRLKAVKKLYGDEKEIDCKRLIGFSKAELRAINIKDNTHAGEWDFELLANWTADLNIDVGLKDELEKESKEHDVEGMPLLPFEKYNYVMIVCNTNLDYDLLVTKLGLKDKKILLGGKRPIAARAVWYHDVEKNIVRGRKEMRDITVLFTAVSGWPTHATVGALRNSINARYTIVGVDCSPNVASKNYVDFLYKVPKCSDQSYVDALIHICLKHHVDVIVPLISEDLFPLSNGREKIEEHGIKILMSGTGSLLDIANDKLKLEQFLLQNGMDVMPKTFKLDMATLDDDLAMLGYPYKPVAVKMRDACGAIGFKIIDEAKAASVNGMTSREGRANPYVTKDQLNRLPEIERYLLQEFVPGAECGSLCLVDHGRTIYCLAHDDYEMQYATTTDCELVEDRDIEDISRKVSELLKLDGNIGYDFKRDADGKARLLECNPRMSAAVCLPVKAGLNIVEFGVFHALGFPVPENIIPKYGVRMQRVYGTLYTYKGEPYGY